MARWPGSTHDAFMLEMSTLARKFQNGDFNPFWLLGDSGYPSKTWLLTPLHEPTTPAERAYNARHKATRSLVERCIGILKARFRYFIKSINIDLLIVIIYIQNSVISFHSTR